MNDKSLINQIIEVLPQLQCKKCEYPDCRSYAQSLIENKEKTNKCEPGGLKTENHIQAILAVKLIGQLNKVKNMKLQILFEKNVLVVQFVLKYVR